MDKDYIQNEAHTMYIGELLEDMIDTVTRTKKMYCDVHIPELFVKGYSHPLTYVPTYMATLPLRKGDSVLVRFKDGDYSLPYLWKNPDELDENLYKKFELLRGGNIPSSDKTVSAHKFGKDSFIIKTDTYTLVRQNKACIILTTDDNIYINGSHVQVVADKFSVVTKNGVSIFSILSDVLDKLNGSVPPGKPLKTAGSPANHQVVPGQFVDDINNLKNMME